MNKLFSLELASDDWGELTADEERGIYELFDTSLYVYKTFDRNGNQIAPPKDYCDCENIKYCLWEVDDPTKCGFGFCQFYPYTTQEYGLTCDGRAYGHIGIKKVNKEKLPEDSHGETIKVKGEKLTEEIFYMVDYESDGYCGVCNEEGKWGFINIRGELVIPFRYDIVSWFINGVTRADHHLIDTDGNIIEGTELDEYHADGFRYVTTTLYLDSIIRQIEGRGSRGLTVDIFDTVTKKYVAKGIPKWKIDLHSCQAEPEVVQAAVALIPSYDKVFVKHKSTIIAGKGETVTVFDYYK